MANTLLTCSQITNEALKVLEDELTGHREYVVEGCGSQWVLVEKMWGTNHKTISTHKTKHEAEAMLKLLQFSED